MTKVLMTKRGADLLREELVELKQVKRPRVIEAIAEARAHGDLKENAEYHAAREQQSFIEGRLKEIEAKLSNAQIIDITVLNASGKVIFGSTVHLIDVDTDSKVSYQIVGDDEANIKEGRISVNSPVARALIAKEDGDEVQVQTPGGIKEYEIESITYEP